MNKDPAFARSVAKRVDDAITFAEKELIKTRGGLQAGIYVIATFLRAIYGQWPNMEELGQASTEFFEGPTPKRTLLREGLRLSFHLTGQHGAAWEVRDEAEEPWFPE